MTIMRVPRYDNFQIGANTLPQTRLTLPEMPDVAGRQAQQMGQNLSALGGELGKVALAMRQQADQARIDDFTNQLVKSATDLQAEALQLKGRNALERPDRQALPDEYAGKMQARIDELDGALGNDDQKRAFRSQAGKIKQQLYGKLSDHMVRQLDVYAAEGSQATLATAIDRAGRLPADEEAFAQSLDAIEFAVKEQTQRAGGDDKMAAVATRKSLDDAWHARYKAWQQEDPVAALGNFQANRNHISPVMRDRIGGELFRKAKAQLTPAAAAWILSAGSAPAERPALANEARGIRNNNPGNIVLGAKWRGEAPGNDPRFATFESPEAGIRAMGKNLLVYRNEYDIATVEGIVSRWAPDAENGKAATGGYIAAVAKALGVKPDERIDVADAQTMDALIRAMIQAENGKQPYSDRQIAAGVGAALGHSELPASTGRAGAPPLPLWRDPKARTGIALIDALPPDQRAELLAGAHAQISQATTQERQALETRVKDVSAEYLTNGEAGNPPGEDEFIRAHGPVEGVRRYRDLQDVAALGQDLQRVRTVSNADMEQMLIDARPEPGEGFAARQHRHEILQKAVMETMKQRRSDPVFFALQNQAFGLAPLADFGNRETLLGELDHRRGVMVDLSRDYGAPPALLSGREAAAFQRYLAAQPEVDKARALGEVFTAVGPEGMAVIAGQMKDETLSIAAMLTPDQTGNGESVGLIYLRGREALTQKRIQFDTAKETEVRADIHQAIRGVYLSPDAEAAATNAALGVYLGLKDAGVDNVERAIELATGGIMTHNNGRIAKPPGWSDDAFTDAVAAVAGRIGEAGGTFLDHGVEIGAEELGKFIPRARLQTFGRGRYLVMNGGDMIRTPDGSPFVLELIWPEEKEEDVPELPPDLRFPGSGGGAFRTLEGS
jgi:hypothetical protein